jgi:FAD/FMN-containing dehydrogenase
VCFVPAHSKFHSSAAFPCPTAATSPALSLPGARRAPVTVAVLHSKLDKVLAVDSKKNTMRVGAGMDLNKFMKAATAAKMSVQIGSLTAYAGLTLAGIFATSAHGSGDKTINNLVGGWKGQLQGSCDATSCLWRCAV